MHWEFLVEEPSAEAALQALWPKLGAPDTLNVHQHQGKPDLLRKLPGRLRGYRHWIPDDWLIVVLVDLDFEDCQALKGSLENIAEEAGLVSKSAAVAGQAIQVVNRLAIRELEAWFFGDVEALVQAYPGVPRTLANRARFRNPDDITHPWEMLEQVLQQAGYYGGGLPKIETARRIAHHMDPDRNRSKSFQVLRDTMLQHDPRPDAETL
jgi:hypothetical protein